MARAIWSGHLSFGLVSIPVGLHSAVEASERVAFRQLHRKDLAPIRYKKFCSKENREVTNAEIVRGYEVAKGRYATVEADELDEVRKELGEGERVVELLQFVDADAIDPLVFEKPYWISPLKGGAKAYGVLREALGDAAKVGIARFYMRTRPLLAVLRPSSGLLSLEVMRTADELRDPRKLAVKAAAPRKNEVAMARALIDQMSGAWDPAAYPSVYRKAVQRLIASKRKFDVADEAGEATGGKKVVDLMQALKESLATSRKPPARGARKKRARARKAA